MPLPVLAAILKSPVSLEDGCFHLEEYLQLSAALLCCSQLLLLSGLFSSPPSFLILQQLPVAWKWTNWWYEILQHPPFLFLIFCKNGGKTLGAVPKRLCLLPWFFFFAPLFCCWAMWNGQRGLTYTTTALYSVLFWNADLSNLSLKFSGCSATFPASPPPNPSSFPYYFRDGGGWETTKNNVCCRKGVGGKWSVLWICA